MVIVTNPDTVREITRSVAQVIAGSRIIDAGESLLTMVALLAATAVGREQDEELVQRFFSAMYTALSAAMKETMT